MTQAKSQRGSVEAADRVFVGVFPTGIGYADRTIEVRGDYKHLAFLPFSTLVLEWSAKRIPGDVRDYIVRDAAKIQARRGERYQVSSAGQTVVLGGVEAAKTATREDLTPREIEREVARVVGEETRSHDSVSRDRAAELIAGYGTWRSTYSNEDFDRSQRLA